MTWRPLNRKQLSRNPDACSASPIRAHSLDFQVLLFTRFCPVPERCNGSSPLEGRKSVISSIQNFHEKVRPTHTWVSWCSLNIPLNPVGDGSHLARFSEKHHTADPTNFRQRAHATASLIFLRRRSFELCRPSLTCASRLSEHPSLNSSLSDVKRTFILLS